MKIATLTIRNYRSISQAYKISLNSNIIVLLGKNNEGKSNILRALSGVFYFITLLKSIPKEDIKKYVFRKGIVRLRRPINSHHWDYFWERDFPVDRQNRKGKTIFDLKFILTEKEQILFREAVGHKFNEELPLTIEIDKDDIQFKIPKKAYGGKNKFFINKINAICKFISDNLSPIFIPAIRPIDTTLNIIDSLLMYRLNKKMIADSEYKKAIDILNKIYKREIDILQRDLKKTINIFLPNVQSIELENYSSNFIERRVKDIKIDDGVRTSIHEKGEGLQSLIALGVMQRSQKENSEFILVIDEPESHLHPEAVRKIKNSLIEIAKKGQVIIATHSPIMVNRDNLAANIIVENKKARPAKKIQDIRDVLGVAVSDNLVNAEFILLVEGETDKKLLMSFLSKKSQQINTAFNEGRLVIHSLGGMKNYISVRSNLNTFICKGIIAYIDNDDVARDNIDKAKRRHLIRNDEYIYAKIDSKKDSELEDLLNINVYEQLLPINRVPDWKQILQRNTKWSENIKKIFDKACGDSIDIEEFKWKVCNKAVKYEDPFNPERKTSLIALKNTLENMISKK